MTIPLTHSVDSRGFIHVRFADGFQLGSEALGGVSAGFYTYELWYFLTQLEAELNAHITAAARDLNSHIDEAVTAAEAAAAAAAALSPQLDQAETRILAAIAGGQGAGSDEIVRAINLLDFTLHGDLTQLVFSLPLVGDTISASVAASGQGIVTGLGSLGEGVGAGLRDAFATLLESLGPALQQFSVDFAGDPVQVDAVMDRVEAGVEEAWTAAIGKVLRVLAGVVGATGPIFGPQLINEILHKWPAVREQIIRAAQEWGEGITSGIHTLHTPMRGVMASLGDIFFRQLDADLSQLGQSTEENVLPAAASILATAGSLGMTSHLVATAAEMCLPGKHLGLSQMAAFLTDLAGFRVVAQNSFGVQFEAALREPARRRAYERFRPSVPDVGRFEELFLKRLAAQGEAETYFARLGWPDHFTTRYLDAVYREPSAREMSLIFEDGRVDQEWAAEKLRRRGFKDGDAEQLLRGLLTRAHKTPRAEAAGALEDAYVDGLLDEDQLLASLRDLQFDDESVGLIRLAAGHKRIRKEADGVRAALLREVELGQLDPDDFRAAMAALGFDARAADHHAFIGRIRVGSRLFAQEQAEARTAIRRFQSTEIEAQLALHRRFLLSDGQLAASLRAVGVLPEEVAALVALAAARRTPVPQLEDVLTPAAQVQEALNTEAKAVLALQRKGVLGQDAAAASLRALGLPAALAAAETRLVAATIRPSELPPVPPTPQEAEEERRVAARDAALARYRNRFTSAETLRQELLAAGVPAAAAQAMVTGEGARRAGQIQREADSAANQELRREQTVLESAAVDAFRGGRLDSEGLRANLLAIGLPAGLADAVVKREEELETTREARAAATTAAASA